jgi:hypothetical protein
MKKRIFLCKWLFVILLFVPVLVQAQISVGGTTQPQKFSVLEVLSSAKKGGLRLPYLSTAQRDSMTNTSGFTTNSLARGLMILNTDNNSVEYWNGSVWVSISNGTSVVSSLSCTSSAFSANAVSEVPYAATLTVPYTGGNLATYAAGSAITSTGVTGLTATLQAGTLTDTGGNLVYDITGTPTSSGTASFALSFGGQSCSAGLSVGAVSLTCASATLISDTAYTGTYYSGTLTIPYTGGNGGAYPSATIASTGVAGLTATLAAGTLASGAGNLVYTVTGTPTSGGTASFVIGFGGQSCTVNLTVSSVVLTCSSATFSGGNAMSGSTYSGTLSIDYTGGTGAAYSGATIASTGVTGLTATLSAGTLSTGSGSFVYTITGTPTSGGTASFAIKLAGQSCSTDLPVIAISTISCSSATFSAGNATLSTAYSGTMSVPYTGGSGVAYPPGTAIASTGVTGLTATLEAGTLATGSGSLVYDITGTPTSGGTAAFALNFGGQSCSAALPVIQVTAITCGSATFSAGNATSGTAYTGTITVPYTGGDGVGYPTTVITSTGVTGLTATLQAGTLAAGAGSLTYTVTGTPSSGGAALFALNFGSQSCSVNLPVIAVTTLDCSSGVFSAGNATSKMAYSGTLTIPYTGGNGVSYPAGSAIASTGVIGLTATLQSGTLANGSGGLVYYITGTPTSGGTATFALAFGGQNCSASLTVNNIVVTALSCSSAVYSAGSATSGTPYTGTLTVPYTGGNGATYPAGSAISCTGVIGLTATLEAGTLTNGAGNLVYDITGTPASGGTASFALSFGGQTCSATLPVIAVSALLCSSATFSAGNATSGTLYSGIMTIPYTGGSGVAYISGMAISSTGVTGLTATLEAGTLANGVGNLIYDISGTPTSGGIATFALNFGGQSCTSVSLPVIAITGLTCSSATFSTTTATAGATYNGTLTVPYTGGSGVPYLAGAAINSTGVTGLTATLEAGTLTSGSGSLIYTIAGTPSSGGTAVFSISFGGQSCSSSLPVASVTALHCSSASFSAGNAIANATYSGTMTIPYDGGSGMAYTAGAAISSTGVTGLTVTLVAGTLANGSGSLTYNITGTPISTGNAVFALSFGGQTCSATLPVPGVTALTCSSATFSSGNATSGNSYTGTMTIPYTGGSGLAYTAGSTISSTGVTGLTATLVAGTLASGSGTLTYNITGTPVYSGTANATFALSFGGQTCSATLPVIGVTALTGSSATFNSGNATSGNSYSGTMTIQYTGGSGVAYAAGSAISSTGVTGLTATLVAGTLTSSSGSLTFNITGTPSYTGTANATFAISFGGQTCSAVTLPVIGVTTLTCSSATFSTTTATAGTAYSATMTISYTGGSGVAYATGTAISSIGVTGLTATLVAGTLTSSSGSLTYNITGTPSYTGTANATFALSFGGQNCSAMLSVIGVTALTCSSATFSVGNATTGTAYSGTMTIPYTSGSEVAYTAGSAISSTGVTGLTATLVAGTLASGSGTLTYNITGTPVYSGTANATFAISFGGQSCSATLPVIGVTALTCNSATFSAKAYASTAYSGTLTVPYTGGNGASYTVGTAINSTGITGLTATLVAGTLASGAGNLTYTITGTPSSSGTAIFALSFGGQSCSSISLNINVACSGYLIYSDVYTPNYGTYLVVGAANSNSSLSAVQSYFTATGGNLCLYSADGTFGMPWSTAVTGCSSGSYADGSTTEGWRLPTIPELGNLQSSHSSYGFVSSYYWCNDLYNASNGWAWDFSGISAINWSVSVIDHHVRCVRTY